MKDSKNCIPCECNLNVQTTQVKSLQVCFFLAGLERRQLMPNTCDNSSEQASMSHENGNVSVISVTFKIVISL